MRAYFLLFLFLLGCQPNSPDDFQSEGAALAKALVLDLREIQSREDFLLAAPKVKKKVQKFVDLMILAAEYHNKHKEELQKSEEGDRYYSHLLLEEFKRIYAIQGCQEVMETLQRDSLHQLDAYLKTLQEKQACPGDVDRRPRR